MSDHSGQPLSPARPGMLERCLYLLSTGLGIGCVNVAPGTFGSLWGLPLVFGLQIITSHPMVMLLIGIGLFLVGIPICAAGIRHYQSGDPKHVVYDEIAAFPFVFLFVPLTWGTAFAGFVLFRIFDITKLWPIRQFERLPGAWGVMSDDLIAGLFACLVLTLMWSLIGQF